MRFGTALAEMRGDYRPQVVQPAAHGLVRDRDPLLREQILDVTKAECEPEIEPNRLGRPPSLFRQTGMPGLDRISRISLRVTRLAPTFEAAALFIFAGTTAIPWRVAAADRTISWVSVSFAMMFASCSDSIRCHQHDPAMGQGRRGRSASWQARTRTTALFAAQVQSGRPRVSGIRRKYHCPFYHRAKRRCLLRR
jgi:hypothetical protein